MLAHAHASSSDKPESCARAELIPPRRCTRGAACGDANLTVLLHVAHAHRRNRRLEDFLVEVDMRVGGCGSPSRGWLRFGSDSFPASEKRSAANVGLVAETRGALLEDGEMERAAPGSGFTWFNPGCPCPVSRGYVFKHTNLVYKKYY